MMMSLRRLLSNYVWTILLKSGLLNTIYRLSNPNLTTSNTGVLIIFQTCYIITIRFGLLFLSLEYILFRLYELPLIWQMCDILYYDILDIPLPELESTRSLKIAFQNAANHEVSFFHILCNLYFSDHVLRLCFIVRCRFTICGYQKVTLFLI